MKQLNFKSVFWALILSAFLSGCASGPAYKAAQGSGYGFSESKLTDNQYRVSFKTRGDDKLMVMDFALLRAAELTQQQGFDWFVVVSRDTLIDQKSVYPKSSVGVGQDIYRSCGVFGCRSRPSTRVGIGLHFGDESREIHSIIEINMGKGIRPENLDSYPANELIKNIRDKYQLID